VKADQPQIYCRRLAVASWIAALIALLVACVPPPSVDQPSFSPGPFPSALESAFGEPEQEVLAAGDIAGCDTYGDSDTAALLDEMDGTVLVLGDLAYDDGTADQFANCYDPTWGRHRARTLPTPGNHEYLTSGAAPYFAYFGALAGSADESWYAWEMGEWLVLSLNSNCDEAGGCGPDSSQGEWLADQLATRQADCTLAFWHHPRWSSGLEHGSDPRTDHLWRVLHDAGADLVLNGHEHVYERLVPLDADGVPADDGLVQIVVGTGGRSLYGFDEILSISAAHDNTSFGIVHLTLRSGAYDWEWVPVAGSTSGFTDAGTAECR
jgi:hypothetical protein